MRILLTGGGTGGHIYPALSLWDYIKKKYPDAQVLYIGSENGLERDIVGHAGLPFRMIPAAGLKRQLSLSALRTFFTTYQGYRQAKQILKEFRPDIVVGTGGYVTLPVIYAAASRGIPSVIWEANARPGLTNQLCARKADVVAIAFQDTERWFKGAKRVVFTGNPRASEVLITTEDAMRAARNRYAIDEGVKLIVCYMGSRGSETVNHVMTQLIPRFAARPDWQLLFATGSAHHDKVMSGLSGIPKNVKVLPFIHDMPSILPMADAVITRAGGATLAEICSLGLASILIPSPYVTANHQEENARRLVEKGAAVMLKESELSPSRLWEELLRLLDTNSGENIRKRAKDIATPDAVDRLAKIVEQTLNLV
jgi:UDP-N-acetylglucosamine--N-acetylmuramyl-(pentapeptide) pyrophosphoryl-undecaprenol N-acetylglucosamine transferase